ncbi:MAG TPA: LysM peptidoglycan-binding domain-containing protein [Victivallales bacterium]|nr:LysM peptidoglycan-binding domain-containing protein [Victivallales bacterium]
MKKFLGMLLILSVFNCGCETFSDSYKRDSNYLASRRLAEAPRAQDQNMAQLAANIAALNASNADIIRRINEISQKITELQQSNLNTQNGLNALKQDLESSKKSWQTANERMIEQISVEMNNVLKSSAASSGAKSSSGPKGTGEFFVHKVEAGSTLNAIAKAYGVSASDIRAANGMSNDAIRVGQTLYIPKK